MRQKKNKIAIIQLCYDGFKIFVCDVLQAREMTITKTLKMEWNDEW